MTEPVDVFMAGKKIGEAVMPTPTRRAPMTPERHQVYIDNARDWLNQPDPIGDRDVILAQWATAGVRIRHLLDVIADFQQAQGLSVSSCRACGWTGPAPTMTGDLCNTCATDDHRREQG